MVKYFVTGASGFVGTEVTKELIKAGHSVIGLARSDAAAEKIKSLGAEVLRGDLEDLESLKEGAKAAEGGVIHLGFIHDWSNFEKSTWIDRRAVEAIADSLEGSNKVFVYTSGLAGLITPIDSPIATEDTHVKSFGVAAIRGGTEELVLKLGSRGIRGTAVRLPTLTHGENDHGFLYSLFTFAKKNGFAAYVGEGENYWGAVSKYDAAKLFVLVAEKGKAGRPYHSVGETDIKTKDLSEKIGKKLSLPAKSVSNEDAEQYLGFLARFYGANIHVGAEKTKKELGWTPTNSTLFEDLEKYYN